MSPEIFFSRLAVLYAIVHVVVFIWDMIRCKTGDFNAKFFWRNESYILAIVYLDIILLALVFTTNFLMTGNPFEIWNG